MSILNIAWSNLKRTKKRAVTTAVAISVGVGSMVFGNGFNDGMVNSWATVLIDRYTGHLRVRHKDYNKFANSDLKRVLIESPKEMISSLKKEPEVLEVMARIQLFGFVGHEDKSSSFVGYAEDSSAHVRTVPGAARMIVEGNTLSDDNIDGVVLGKALADKLDVKVNDELVVLSTTIYSETSAIAVKVVGLTDIEDNKLEQRLLIANLKHVQEQLLDVGKRAGELVIRLRSKSKITEVQNRINKRFRDKGLPWEVITWNNNKKFQSVTSLYKGIALVSSVIMAIIVSVIISSTLLMSAFERIKEIGTMRAIGAKKRFIFKLFYVEGILITLIGTVLGFTIGLMVIFVTNKIGINLSVSNIIIRPIASYRSLLLSLLLPFLLSAIMIYVPIRSSCKISIIEAIDFR